MNETETYKKLKNKPKDNNVEWLIIHHSGGTNANPLTDTSNHTAQMMEAWHLLKGWEGLGYHYVIHKDGAIWAGRPEHRNGAHTVGYNERSIGICMSGNFDLTRPTLPQINSLKSLLIDLTKRYNLNPIKIVPHRLFATKTCYGKNLTNDWARNLLDIKLDEKLDAICETEKKEINSLKKVINDLYRYII